MADPFFRLSPDPIPAEQRVAARVEYDGSEFNGWQIQGEGRTVQAALEGALASVADRPVRVHCAGRTDTGVHGHGQVVHFDPQVSRSSKSWVMGCNRELPSSIRLHWALAVPADFHARHSATARRYRYLIANSSIRPAQFSRQLSWCRQPLDVDRMNEAAQDLVGEQDFSAFRAATCQSQSPMRQVRDVSVHRQKHLIVLDICANAFLHHMVRNIAGSLMAVGSGRQPVTWIAELLENKDRRLAADTASPQGLYLIAVEYPDHFALPETPPGPLLALD